MTMLKSEARWRGREVGRLRDLDVVANDIVGGRPKPIPKNRVFRRLPMPFEARRRNCANVCTKKDIQNVHGSRRSFPEKASVIELSP